MKTLQERFEEKAYQEHGEDGCWLWEGSIGSGGYGQFCIKGKSYLAHRVAYEWYVGPIPKHESYHGTCVCHMCDVRSCVNPEHLFLGTHQENVKDMVSKGRKCKGSSHALAKLTEGKALQIFHSQGSHVDIANRFAVSSTLVGGIKLKQRWAHIHKRTKNDQNRTKPSRSRITRMPESDMKTLQERFDEKYYAEPRDGCWLWEGSINNGGYAAIGVGKKMVHAHRVSWELHIGPIPEGEGYHGTCVCHHCDVRSCVRPDHLFLGDHQQNMADRDAKGRRADASGEAVGTAKLTDAKVLEIRADSGTHREIAEKYGIDRSNVGYIKARKTWKHIH